jgi:hypothetical protein
VDEHFLEFWGHVLLTAAKGQRQLDELARWMSQGMSGVGDLTAMFRRIYGLGSDSSVNGENWRAACDSFGKAYRAYLDALEVVPKTEYLALKRQLEELQAKAEDQEAALRRLRLELSESRMTQGDVVRGFQELVRVQSEQFQELTESFPRFFFGRRTDREDPGKS